MESAPEEMKIWLVARTDLGLSQGKLAVQAMHAIGGLLVHAAQRAPDALAAYQAGATPKICLRVDSLDALTRVVVEAMGAGVPCYVVSDAGRSEVAPGTKTVCAFGPALRSELPSYLRRLRLLDGKEGAAYLARQMAKSGRNRPETVN